MPASGGGLSVGIVAGEPSGDLLGAMLVQALRRLIPNVDFVGIAGPRMQAAGVKSLYPMSKLAVRGYVEVMRNLFEIISIRRKLRREFEAHPPALFIGVDAPDFNLSLERALRARGVTTVHFVSPSIWAWRYERVHKIRKAVSHMLALFPFEAPIYVKEGVPVTYVGHPLADALPDNPEPADLREQLRVPVAGPVVAMLPGSRMSELEQMGEIFLHTAALIAERLGEVTFLFPAVTREARDYIERTRQRLKLESLRIQVMFGHAHAAIGAADICLIASGTATLEAALIGRPMVITYRMPKLSWALMYRHRRLPYVGLPNILAGEFIVPELLQTAATPENLAQALVNLLADDEVQDRLRSRFADIRVQLRQDAANTAARAIHALVRRA